MLQKIHPQRPLPPDGRVATPANGLWVPVMFRRLANCLFMHWRGQPPKAKYQTTIDFQADMDENSLAKAMRFVACKCPRL